MVADIGVSPAVDAVAFAQPVGATSDVIATENGAAVVKVVERPAINDTELAGRPRLAAPRADVDAPGPVLHRLHEQGEGDALDQQVRGRHRPRLRAVVCRRRFRPGTAARASSAFSTCTSYPSHRYSLRPEVPWRPTRWILRSRVLRDADAGLPSKDIAVKYAVSRAWVDRVKQRRRETGELAPRKQTTFRGRSLSPDRRNAPRRVDHRPARCHPRRAARRAADAGGAQYAVARHRPAWASR